MTDKPGRAYEHVQRKLTEQERTALRESLSSHGLLDEITLDQRNDILDGYNREDLCGELGIAKRYRTLEVNDPVHWIRHNQTARRNLTEAEMRELIVEMKANNPEASTRTIAEKLGVNHTTVSRTLNKSTVAGATVVNRVKGKDGKVRTYRKSAPKQDKATHAIERREQAGEPVTREAIVAEAGVSRGVADTALAAHKAKAKPIDPDDIILSMSAQEKFDAKVRAFRKGFDYEVETKVRAGIRKHLDEYSIPGYMELLHKVERMLEHKRGVMKRAEFRIIQRCLHPDTGAHVSDENRNEAFRLFMALEARLVDDDREQADLKRVSTLPRTIAEMQRAREEVRAANSARAKAAHAARKFRST